jgi:hypothetical protein
VLSRLRWRSSFLILSSCILIAVAGDPFFFAVDRATTCCGNLVE